MPRNARAEQRRAQTARDPRGARKHGCESTLPWREGDICGAKGSKFGEGSWRGAGPSPKFCFTNLDPLKGRVRITASALLAKTRDRASRAVAAASGLARSVAGFSSGEDAHVEHRGVFGLRVSTAFEYGEAGRIFRVRYTRRGAVLEALGESRV